MKHENVKSLHMLESLSENGEQGKKSTGTKSGSQRKTSMEAKSRELRTG